MEEEKVQVKFLLTGKDKFMSDIDNKYVDQKTGTNIFIKIKGGERIINLERIIDMPYAAVPKKGDIITNFNDGLIPYISYRKTGHVTIEIDDQFEVEHVKKCWNENSEQFQYKVKLVGYKEHK